MKISVPLFLIFCILFEVALLQSSPDLPPPPPKRIPGGRSGGAKWVWCTNKAKWEIGNPQNCKGVTDKAAFDAICTADWTKNFEGEGLWIWDPSAKPKATYCKKMPTCFCELCDEEKKDSDALEYKFFNEAKSWYDAEKSCVKEGGHLASIHSKEDHEKIINLVKDVPSYRVWIGGSDDKREGKWQWTDDTKWDYEAWSTGQPDNYRGNQDCNLIW